MHAFSQIQSQHSLILTKTSGLEHQKSSEKLFAKLQYNTTDIPELAFAKRPTLIYC